MPKELTAQPCDLSHQLSDTFLQPFILLHLSLSVADSDVIDIDKFFPAACCPLANVCKIRENKNKENPCNY